MRRHEIRGHYGTQRNNEVVGSPIAHDAYGAHWQEYREGLRGLVVPAPAVCVFGGTQLIDENCISPAQQIGVLLLHLTQDAHAEPRPGERMAITHSVG